MSTGGWRWRGVCLCYTISQIDIAAVCMVVAHCVFYIIVQYHPSPSSGSTNTTQVTLVVLCSVIHQSIYSIYIYNIT